MLNGTSCRYVSDLISTLKLQNDFSSLELFEISELYNGSRSELKIFSLAFFSMKKSQGIVITESNEGKYFCDEFS